MAFIQGVEAWRGQVRLPMPMYNFVKQRSINNYRSVNAELIEIIREQMGKDKATTKDESNGINN